MARLWWKISPSTWDCAWSVMRKPLIGSGNVAAHHYILGRNTTRHLTLVAEQKRAATDVALDLAVDLDLAFRGDVAFDRQVLADN